MRPSKGALRVVAANSDIKGDEHVSNREQGRKNHFDTNVCIYESVRIGKGEPETSGLNKCFVFATLVSGRILVLLFPLLSTPFRA